MHRTGITLIAALALAAGVTSAQVGPALRTEFAPTGVLRAGINYGNVVLAQRNPTTGELRGIAVDLSRALGERLGLEVRLVPYPAAGQMTDDLARNASWDVAFLGVDPTRGQQIAFTAPYLQIEGTYLVPPGSPLKTIADVDRPGVRIAVGAKSAYDLFLSGQIRNATIVRAPTSRAAIDLFAAERLEVVAGVRAALEQASAGLPGSRVMEGRFMVIEQGAGVPAGRDAAAAYLRAFIEDVKASGFVRDALRRHGVERDASVAPAAK
jgi:polar amino acid transport system substrate-binding protein